MADREVLDVKTPPHSVEAEQSVLGGLMLDGAAWERIAELVSEPDFYREDHRLIFHAIAQLAAESQPIDAVTVFEQLERSGEAGKTGGLAYLAELARNTPSASNIIQYANIVRERALLREMIEVAHEVADSAYFPKGKRSQELLDSAEAKMLAIAEKRSRSDSGPKLIDGKMLLGILDQLDSMRHTGGITGISTGYRDLDAKTSGLQRGDMIIVAARPSMGKTTFAMNLAENIMMSSDKPVLVFSLEMPADQIVMRMFASMSRVQFQRIRSGMLELDDWDRLQSTVLHMKTKNNLYIDDTGGLSPIELRARARRVFRERGGLSLIVIDYLQLMRGDGGADNRTNEVSEISRALKALAKELSVPVIALSQLNRSLEQRDNKRPIMADLRESGAIEQDADVILFIHREEVYERRKNKQEGGGQENTEFVPQSRGQAEVIIGKQRNGPIGTVMLRFKGEFTRFDDSDEAAPEDMY